MVALSGRMSVLHHSRHVVRLTARQSVPRVPTSVLDMLKVNSLSVEHNIAGNNVVGHVALNENFRRRECCGRARDAQGLLLPAPEGGCNTFRPTIVE